MEYLRRKEGKFKENPHLRGMTESKLEPVNYVSRLRSLGLSRKLPTMTRKFNSENYIFVDHRFIRKAHQAKASLE